jgi:predicted DNA-binding transcriptional regulator YafY
MNRTDRLLAIVLELQGKGTLRAEDLAATFETCKRTIYRDIQALSQAGIPLISIPGRGYSLIEGYFLPPLNFSVEEATTLLLGSAYIEQAFDAQYRAAAQAASRKIAGVLPAAVQAQVGELRQSLALAGSNFHERPREAEMLQSLRRAILDRQRVRFAYHARTTPKSQTTTAPREVDPFGLVYRADTWYLTGYCHLRRGVRHFRLERMEDLALLGQTFHRPADFTMRYDPTRESDRTFQARILFDNEVTRWVMEDRFYFMVATDETAEGMIVTVRSHHAEDVVPWLLRWGRHARVLEPDSLRRQVADEARAMLNIYSPTT